MDPWFFDENFNGLSDETYDDVIKFFNSPLEEVEHRAVEEDRDAQFKHLKEPYFDDISLSLSGLCDTTRKGNPKLERISTSHAEISPVEQLPETTEVTSIKSIPNPKAPSNGKDFFQFQIYSPASVFESSSSSSVPFVSSSQAFQKRRRAAAAESDFETFRTRKPSYGPKEKQTKKDLYVPSSRINMKRSSLQESSIPRKCMHCEVTKTPMWRGGPMGPKTLCNACGLRYRSGRLYTEYRPAASPTYVASLHSNRHRNVLELRNRAISEDDRGSGSVLHSSSKASRNLQG